MVQPRAKVQGDYVQIHNQMCHLSPQNRRLEILH